MVKIKPLKLQSDCRPIFFLRVVSRKLNSFFGFGINCTALDQSKLSNFVECTINFVIIDLGYFEKAVKEHTREVQLSEAIQDTIGTAVAHRKVGECLCALKKYKDALLHQNLHLEVFKADRLQMIVVAKKIYLCCNCSSVGCLKCVQFYNWFRLH